MKSPVFSVIIPVYNRPQEVKELLLSLSAQRYKDFEVLIVEDGSTIRCDDVVDRFREQLNVHYFFKPNSGPGPSRNFGYAHARGDYFVVFDSDCILPPTYFEAVQRKMKEETLDAWGGPDRASDEFTLVQRAMGYTMSSVLTTGGIRGGKKHVGWFQPRSFNMGISREVFEKTNGFRFDRFAEDIEFSIRMKQAGFRVVLISDAFVYHKRRTNFREFYKQVSNFGKGRALVGEVFPGEVKLAHWFPTLFITGFFLTLIVGWFNSMLSVLAIGCYVLYFVTIFIHSWHLNRNLAVALLSVPAAILQLSGYGIGFLSQWIRGYLKR